MTDLTHILNWRRINARLTTSGQPNADQLGEIRQLGVTHVINLGLGYGEGALTDEAAILSDLGMTYSHIPVDFKNPRDTDFDSFTAALVSTPRAQIHIHCIYNARVSAFFYRYAKAKNDLSQETVFAIMDSIWRPGADWAGFLRDPAAEGKPNLYAGQDY